MEIGELSQLNATDKENDDKCPLCYKAPHEFPGRKEEKPSTKVVSKPQSLGCSEVPGGGPGRYTTAAHHLIPAIQCYARIRRIVRMGNMVGYDINSSPNGIGLPTVKNPYGGRNYRALEDEEKRDVSFKVMDATKAQWHVGHHSFEITLPGDWGDEGGEDKEVAHTPSYDNSVVQMLLEVMEQCIHANLCDDEGDGAGDFIDAMNEVSEEIKTYLEKFKTYAPWSSHPFFVSERAFSYAKAVRTREWPP